MSGSSPSRSGHVIPCGDCGAALHIDLEAEVIRCVHCDAAQEISGGDRARMRDIAREIRRTDGVSNSAAEVRRRLRRPTVLTLFFRRWYEKAIRVVLDTRRVPGWNQLDAVGLVPVK